MTALGFILLDRDKFRRLYIVWLVLLALQTVLLFSLTLSEKIRILLFLNSFTNLIILYVCYSLNFTDIPPFKRLNGNGGFKSRQYSCSI